MPAVDRGDRPPVLVQGDNRVVIDVGVGEVAAHDFAEPVVEQAYTLHEGPEADDEPVDRTAGTDRACRQGDAVHHRVPTDRHDGGSGVAVVVERALPALGTEPRRPSTTASQRLGAAATAELDGDVEVEACPGRLTRAAVSCTIAAALLNETMARPRRREETRAGPARWRLARARTRQRGRSP